MLRTHPLDDDMFDNDTSIYAKSGKKKSKKHKKKSKKHKVYDTDTVYYYDPHMYIRDRFLPGLPMMQNPSLEREGTIIPEYMILNPYTDSGIHLGRRMYLRNYYIGKHQDHDGHIIVYGGTGSGKSYSIAKPTICTWKAPIFAIDIKGELEAIARARNRPHKTLNLTREGGSCKLEPFLFLHIDGEENVSQNAAELADAIIPIPSNISERFWLESARNTLTAGILFYYKGMGFIETMIEINSLDFKELIDKIYEGTNDLAKSYINRDVLLNPKMYAGISAEFKNHIRIFATDMTIQNALSPSYDPACEFITWEDLKTHDIFIRINQRQLRQWGRVVGMLVAQLMRSLEDRPEKHTPEGEAMKPVLLLIDEFARLGKLDVIIDALESLRSKKVTIALFCQSLADLDAIYGEYDSRRINDNCCFKAVLNAFDSTTQQYLSTLTGTKIVVMKGVTASYSFGEWGMPGIGINLNESVQPVIPPHEFASLNDVILLHPEGFSRIDNISHFLPGHPKNPNNKISLNP